MRANKLVLISDYDGTITKKDIKKLKKFQKDNILVIATGRYFHAIYQELIKYKIKIDFLICNDGAEIYDHDFNLLYYEALDKTDVLKIKNLNIEKIKYNYDKNKQHLISINLYEKIKLNLNNSKIEYKVNKIKILPKNANKVKAVDFLVKHYNLNNIITVGNDINDYDMLIKYNGYKIKGSTLDINKEVKNIRSLIRNLKHF